MRASSVPSKSCSIDQLWACEARADDRRREMRRLFSHIRHLIEERYSTAESQNKDLPWQGVSSFLFLRFFVPAILHPHLFGIWPGEFCQGRVVAHALT